MIHCPFGTNVTDSKSGENSPSSACAVKAFAEKRRVSSIAIKWNLFIIKLWVIVVLSISVFDRIWKVNNVAKLAKYSNILAMFAEKVIVLCQYDQYIMGCQGVKVSWFQGFSVSGYRGLGV